MSLDYRRLNLINKKFNNTSYRVPAVSATLTANVFVDGLTSSTLYIAVPQANGQVHVLPNDAAQYDGTKPFIVDAIAGQTIMDLAFSPQQPNVLAVISGTTLRVFQLPADGVLPKGIMKAPVVEIQGQGFTTIVWSKVVKAMAAISTASGVALVDLSFDEANTAELIQRDPFLNYPLPNMTVSTSIVRLNFSQNGKILTAIGKDGSFYAFDPRARLDVNPQQDAFNASIKFPQYATFIQEQDSPNQILLIVGLNQMKKPRFAACQYDPTTQVLSKAFHIGDMAQSSGQVIAQYDPESQFIALTTRSSQTLTFFDTTHISVAKPAQAMLPVLNAVISTAKALNFCPKTLIDVSETEIQRFYLHNGTTVEQYAVSAVKKDRGYAADIHPDTYDGANVQNTIENYLNEVDVVAPTKTLNPYVFTTPAVTATASGTGFGSATAKAAGADNQADAAAPAVVAGTTVSQNKDMFEKGYDKSIRSQIEAKYSRSTFLHTSGREPGFNKDTWSCYDVNVSQKHIAYGRTLNGNSDFYVIPIRSQNAGVLYPRLTSEQGRAPTEYKAIRLQAPISAVAVRPQLVTKTRHVAVATDDGLLQIYELPADWKSGELPMDIVTPKYTYELGVRVQCLQYHPYVEDCLVASGYAAEAQKEIVFLFDTSTEGSFQPYEDLVDDRVCHFSFSPDGCHMAICDKKNTITVVTLPSAQVRFTIKHGASPKECWALWYNKEYLVTVGTVAGGQRGVTLHKIDWSTLTTKVVKTETFFNNYLLIPYLDVTGVLVLAGVGTANMHIFFIDPSNTTQPIDNLSTFASRGDVVGVQFLEKRDVNVDDVEVIRAIKLSQKNEVWPVNFVVPRKRKEFFQDDIYATGAIFDPIISTQDFFNAVLENAVTSDPNQQQYVAIHKSLQPPGTTPLSEAPEEELTAMQQRYLQNKQKEFNEDKPTNFMGMTDSKQVEDYYSNKLENFGVYDRFSAKAVVTNDVADDEWD